VLAGCSSGEPGRAADAVIRGVHYVGVSVSNIEQTEIFYRDVANLKSVMKGEFHQHPVVDSLAQRDGVKVATKLVKSSNAQLRLMEFEDQSEAAKNAKTVQVFGPGIAHVCFQVNQNTETYQKFLKAGGEAIGDLEMVTNPATHVSYAYGWDLDDTIVEIEHVNVEALELDVPPKNDYRIRHVSLATPDMERAANFYSILLQEEHPRSTNPWFPVSGEFADKVTGEAGSKLNFTWFQVRNLELEIIEYASHKTQVDAKPRPLDAHGYNMIVFDVTDMQAARERLIAAGGTIVFDVATNEDSQDQLMDGEEIMFARDLDGNLLGFQTLADSSALSSQNFADNGL